MSKPMQPKGEVIELKQRPIIAYDLIEAKGKEIEARIAELNIDAIEPNENNLKLIKGTRSAIRKEFEVLENKRKMVKELILKPYNDFEAAYKEHISSRFKDADLRLKEKAAVVEDELLKRKIENLKAYFDEINQFDFVGFYDMELKITRSASDKKLKEEIDAYLENIANAVETIKTLSNSDRVLAKFQISKDLNRAISETNIEIEREEAIKKAQQQREERLAKARSTQEIEEVVHEVAEEAEPKIQEEKAKEKLYRATFTVTATVEQIKALKEYMNAQEIKYESK